MKIKQLIDHYKTVKSLHGKMSDSLADKLHHIDRVFGYMDTTCTGTEIVRVAKAEWSERSPGTLKRYLVQLKAILNRAERDDLLPRAQMVDLPYVNDTVYVDVTGIQIDMLLDVIKWTEPRWYPLALLLSQTGMRLGEALGVSVARDISPRGVIARKPVNRKSKTIERLVPMTRRLKREYEAGLFDKRTIVPSGMSAESVSSCLGRAVHAACEVVGCQRLRVHDLRHAFAVIVAEKGGDLGDIASALGHSHINMSMRYRGLVRSRLTNILSA